MKHKAERGVVKETGWSNEEETTRSAAFSNSKHNNPKHCSNELGDKWDCVCVAAVS